MMDVEDIMHSTSDDNDTVMTPEAALPPTFGDADPDDCILVLKILKRREAKYCIGNYLRRFHNENPSAPKDCVDVLCRNQMCQWINSIVDFCKCDRSSVASAMSLLDRFLNVSPWALKDRKTFQLAAMTSIYLSLKVNEVNGLGLDSMVAMSKNTFSMEQFEAMERSMVEACQWYLNPPTANQMGHWLAQWASQQDSRLPIDALLDLINMQVENAVYDYYLIAAAPSLVSIAALLNAMDSMGLFTTQEQQSIKGKVTTTLEMSHSDLHLLPQVQQRLYELLSIETVLCTSHDTISESAPSAKVISTTTTTPSQSRRCPQKDVRPISPQSVSAREDSYDDVKGVQKTTAKTKFTRYVQSLFG